MKHLTIVVAWLVLVVAAVHPPHGLGVPVCVLEAASGLPCPGCGLTRSLSCAMRGMFHASWDYHPFGIAFLALFAAVATASLLPSPARRRLDAAMSAHGGAVRLARAAFIGAFLAYGAARAIAHLVGA
jgi:hypothetical protein